MTNTMINTIIHVGDVGTVFELTIVETDGTVVDVSGASELVIHFEKPDKTRVTKTATLMTNGADGRILYTSVAGDIDAAGQWKMQGHIVFQDGSAFFSEKTEFPVHTNIAPIIE